MALQIPRLQASFPIVDDKGQPTQAFMIWWDRVASAIEGSILSIEDALAAAGIALEAAEVAQAAAEAAQSAADSAGATSKLSGSGVTDMTFSATDAGASATVTISAHTRVYSDGSTVAVNSGSLTGLAYSTTYYVYYDDAGFAGGAVTYVATTTQSTAIQTGDRHLVGQITTPAALGAPNDGYKTRPPGYGNMEQP